MNFIRYLKYDLKSSFVVFLVAIPLCLGIALASGAPLMAGILSGIIGGVVVGSLSSSQVSVSGPAAGLIIIVINAIQGLGDFYSFTLAVFLAGLIQIALGLMKAGNAGNYFPSSVIKGMLTAIGLLLIFKQLPHLVGYDSDFMGDLKFLQLDQHNTFSELILAIKVVHPGAIIISSSCILLMFLWNYLSKKSRFFELIPNALGMVLLGILTNYIFYKFLPDLSLKDENLVQLHFGEGLLNFLNQIHLPHWSALSNPLVYKTALTLAIVASLESLLSVDAADKIDPAKRNTNKNRELIAQGSGNLLAGLLGGLPITSVIVRTSANITNGCKTKFSTILHGTWLFCCVVFLTQYLEKIPLACLATILLLVGLKLTKPSIYKEMWQKGKEQFIPFIVTILAILFTDLLVGVSVGIAVGLFFAIKSNDHRSIVLVNNDQDYLIRFMKDVCFLQKPRLLKFLDSIPENTNLLIDGSNSFFVDHDIIFTIEDFLTTSKEKNINVEVIKSSVALNPFFKE